MTEKVIKLNYDLHDRAMGEGCTMHVKFTETGHLLPLGCCTHHNLHFFKTHSICTTLNFRSPRNNYICRAYPFIGFIFVFVFLFLANLLALYKPMYLAFFYILRTCNMRSKKGNCNFYYNIYYDITTFTNLMIFLLCLEVIKRLHVIHFMDDRMRL